MVLTPAVRDKIVRSLLELGKPATIQDIERKVGFERHTLTKYLGILLQEGMIGYNSVGRARLWHINTAPLETLLKADTERMGFAERMLIDILNNSPAGVLVMTMEYQIQFMNRFLVSLYGDCENGFFYHHLLGHKDPLQLGTIRGVVEGTRPLATEDLEDKNGRILSVRASTFTSPVSRPSVILIIDDITEQRRSQDALRESEEHYRTLVEMSPDAVMALDIDGDILMVNHQAVQLLKYKRETELVGKSIFSLMPKESVTKARKHRLEMLLQKNVVKKERYEFLTKKGTPIPVESNTSPLYDADGVIIGFVKIIRDITDQKRYEDALQGQAKQYKILADASLDATMATNAEGKIVFANASLAALLGYGTSDELLGTSVLDVIPKELRDDATKRLALLQGSSSDRVTGTYTLRTRQGERLPANVTATAVRAQSGRVEGFAAVIKRAADGSNTTLKSKSKKAKRD